MARARKYGPAFGKQAKSAIKQMIADGSVIAVKPAKKARKPKVSQSVKSYVKKAIDISKEDHVRQPDPICNQAPLNASGFNSQQIVATVGTTNFYRGLTTPNLMPTVLKGDNVDNRTGNAIKPKFLEVSYILNANPLQKGRILSSNTNDWYNNIGKPFWVRVVIYRRKDNQFSPVNNTILDDGAVVQTYEDITDQKLPYNKDLFQILYSKNIRMSPSRGETYTQNTTTLTDAITWVNSKGTCSNYNGRVRLKLPSRLLFNDDDNQPTNYACFMAAGCIMTDGSFFRELPNTNMPEYGAEITVRTRLVFEDI